MALTTNDRLLDRRPSCFALKRRRFGQICSMAYCSANTMMHGWRAARRLGIALVWCLVVYAAIDWNATFPLMAASPALFVRPDRIESEYVHQFDGLGLSFAYIGEPLWFHLSLTARTEETPTGGFSDWFNHLSVSIAPVDDASLPSINVDPKNIKMTRPLRVRSAIETGPTGSRWQNVEDIAVQIDEATLQSAQPGMYRVTFAVPADDTVPSLSAQYDIDLRPVVSRRDTMEMCMRMAVRARAIGDRVAQNAWTHRLLTMNQTSTVGLVLAGDLEASLGRCSEAKRYYDAAEEAVRRRLDVESIHINEAGYGNRIGELSATATSCG
jgi:hypothetical protein